MVPFAVLPKNTVPSRVDVTFSGDAPVVLDGDLRAVLGHRERRDRRDGDRREHGGPYPGRGPLEARRISLHGRSPLAI